MFSCAAIASARGASAGLLLGVARAQPEDAVPREVLDDYFSRAGYSVAPRQELSVLPWPDGADLQDELEVIVSEFLVGSGALEVVLDVTHGPNFLPVALRGAVDWACRVASSVAWSDLSLRVYAASPPAGGGSRVHLISGRRFTPGSSLRDLAWRVLEEDPPPSVPASLAADARISASALLFSLLLPLSYSAADAVGWRRASSGWESSALALLAGIRRVLEAAGIEPGHPLSLESSERLVEELRSMHLPSHVLAAIEVRRIRRAVLEHLRRGGGRGTVSLEEVLQGRERGEDPAQFERNLVAHAGFDISSVMVDLSGVGSPEEAGRARLFYRDWRGVREVLLDFSRGMVARRTGDGGHG